MLNMLRDTIHVTQRHVNSEYSKQFCVHSESFIHSIILCAFRMIILCILYNHFVSVFIQQKSKQF